MVLEQIIIIARFVKWDSSLFGQRLESWFVIAEEIWEKNLEIEIGILLCCLELIGKLAAGRKKYRPHRVVSMFGIASLFFEYKYKAGMHIAILHSWNGKLLEQHQRGLSEEECRLGN